MMVSAEDLDDWERCLDALQAEERALWPAGDRTAWLDVGALTLDLGHAEPDRCREEARIRAWPARPTPR
ncbi:DUF5959 family protein, partial [Nocardiopsis sp. CNT312]|uniref:DUF5959 family protein n=1 Tax=Nocardiopsis sp. CNT312 TaxID=1137268 RepID=UPI00350F84AC